MTINKQIKTAIDELEVGDEILCTYIISEIDDDYFTLEEKDGFKFKVVDSGELFDMMFEEIQEYKANS